LLDIIIVDDASTDRTGEISDQMAARDSCIRVLRNPTNQGVGVGFLAALDIAKYPKFMGIPGDNDVSGALLTKMMAMHDRADLILGYFLNKEDRGRRRNVLSTIYIMMYTITFNVFIQYVNSPAIYPTGMLRKLDLKSRRFSIASEATIKSLRAGCTFCEVAGYMQTGLKGSTSVRMRNLVEAIYSYFRLIYEIYVQRPHAFKGKATRIRI
jgi:glycosyltransferase involved in cell wall biosynthesis